MPLDCGRKPTQTQLAGRAARDDAALPVVVAQWQTCDWWLRSLKLLTSVILHLCTAELISVNTFMFVYMENSAARLQVEELWHHFEGRTDFDVDSELFHLNEIILKCSQSKKIPGARRQWPAAQNLSASPVSLCLCRTRRHNCDFCRIIAITHSKMQKLQVLGKRREDNNYPPSLSSHKHYKHQDGCKILTNGVSESITSGWSPSSLLPQQLLVEILRDGSISMQQNQRGALIGLILSQLPCGKQLMKNPLSHCNE